MNQWYLSSKWSTCTLALNMRGVERALEVALYSYPDFVIALEKAQSYRTNLNGIPRYSYSYVANIAGGEGWGGREKKFNCNYVKPSCMSITFLYFMHKICYFQH